MQFESFSKFSWTERHCSKILYLDLFQTCSKSIEAHFVHNTLPVRIQEMLILDVVYAVLRNQRWYRLDLFREILIDYLVSSYALEQSGLFKVLDDINSRLLEIGRDPLREEATEEELLRFLYVSSIRSEDTSEMRLRFGLGDHIFCKIKRAAEVVVEMEEGTIGDSHARFLPDLETQFVHVIIDLCAEKCKDPLIYDKIVLSHAVSELPPLEKIPVVRMGLDYLLNLLAELGAKKEFGSEKLSIQANAEDQERGDTLLGAFQKLGFLFAVKFGKNASQQIWTLSDLGLEFAARTFACSFWRENQQDIDSFKVFSLNPTYQSAVLQISDVEFCKQLVQKKDSLNGLSPKAFSILLSRLDDNTKKSFCSELLTEGKYNSWLRKIACESIKNFSRDEENVRNLLLNVSRVDQSPMVREAAVIAYSEI